jgi:hypothetical protein
VPSSFIVFLRNLFSCEYIKAKDGRKILFVAVSLGIWVSSTLHERNLLGKLLGL